MDADKAAADSNGLEAESRKWEKQSKDNKTAMDAATPKNQSTLDVIAKALGLEDDLAI